MIRTLTHPLTVLAVFLVPPEAAILGVRKHQVEHMLVAAQVANSPIEAFGIILTTHGLVGLALPIFQMIAFSGYFIMSRGAMREQQTHLRKLAALLWITVSVAELAVSVSMHGWRLEAAVPLLVTVSLMLADCFGGAVILEQLIVVLNAVVRKWR